MVRRGLDALADMQNKLAYDDYLRRLDVMSVLDHYGVENAREEAGKSGTVEVVHSCLLDRIDSHHSNGDANPSASANLQRKKYVCWAYWGGDMFQFIQKMENKDGFTDVLPVVKDFLEGRVADNESFLGEVERLFSSSSSHVASGGLSGYSDRVLVPWAWVHPFLAERGVDSDTAKRLQIGWREDLNRITIPVWWDGELVGWQARSIPDRPGQWPGTWGGGVPKYKSSPGFPKSSVFYTVEPKGCFPRVGNVIVVVESPFSVIKASSLGVNRRVVATFGAKVSDIQCRMLRSFDHVVVWADDDTAGRIMEQKIVAGIGHHTRVSVVIPDEEKDMGDYGSIDDIEAKIDSAVPSIMKINEWENSRG